MLQEKMPFKCRVLPIQEFESFTLANTIINSEHSFDPLDIFLLEV